MIVVPYLLADAECRAPAHSDNLPTIFFLTVDDEVERSAGQCFKAEYVAVVKIQQIAQQKPGACQKNLGWQHGRLDQVEHSRLLLLGRSTFPKRPLLVELLPHHFYDDRRHCNIHHSDRIAYADLNGDGNNRLRRSEDLQELRFSLNGVDCKIDVGDKRPRLAQVSQDEAKEPIEQDLLDLLRPLDACIYTYWLTCDPKEQGKRILGRQRSDLDWELSRFVQLQEIQAKAAQTGFIGVELDTTDLTSAEVAGKIWQDIKCLA